MLETLKLKILPIDSKLIQVVPRAETSMEKNQIRNLGLYFIWPYLKQNILLPRPFNSLENVAFKRNSPLIIPKILHQIWLSDS